MPKEKKVEVEVECEADLSAINAFLKEETASEDEREDVNALLDDMSSTTCFLSAFEHAVAEDGDEIGAALIKEFRVRFAKHELELGDEEAE